MVEDLSEEEINELIKEQEKVDKQFSFNEDEEQLYTDEFQGF
jgi:hypothetical protein